MIDIFIILLLLVLISLVCVLMYRQQDVIWRQKLEVVDLQEFLKVSRDREDRLTRDFAQANRITYQAIEDRLLLVEFAQIIWESRDTDAAARWVKNLITPSIDNHHYTIGECYHGLKTDLGMNDARRDR